MTNRKLTTAIYDAGYKNLMEFANDTDLCYRTIWNIVNKLNTPHERTIYEITKKLDKSPEELGLN
jgi:hypothetical protein